MKTVRNNPDESTQPATKNHVAHPIDAALADDALARRMVVRYTPFDPDARAFVMPCGVNDSDAPMVFASPEEWGFEKIRNGYHWTAKGLFDLTGLPTAPPTRSQLTRPRFHDIFDDIQSEHRSGRIRGDRGDPFHCATQLRQLLIIAETRSAAGSLDDSLAFRLAVALGNCRQFGLSLAGQDFTLSRHAATLAARHAITQTRDLEQATQNPPQNATVAMEQLEGRMDLWAAT